MQHFRAGGAGFFRQRKNRRGNWRAWVDYGAQMRVIIIQQIGRDGIDESGFHDAELFTLPINTRDRFAGAFAHDLKRGDHRRIARDTKRTADMVQDGSPPFMTQRLRQGFKIGFGDEACQGLRG